MKRIVLSASMLIISIIGFSQAENSEKVNKVRFGYNNGVNYSILHSKETLPDNAKIYNGAGFRLGIFMDYSISENLIVSPIFEVSFNKSKVDYSNPDNSKTTFILFPSSLEFMTHVIYKIGNSKMIPYFLTGPNFKLPLNRKPDSGADFGTTKDFAIDFGFGIENVLKYFIFAPELRYSLGLLNINENPALKTWKFNNISIILKFK